MTSTTITDNPLIHDLYRLPGPVLTVYLNAPPAAGSDVLPTLLDELRDSGAAPAAVEALGSVLATVQPGRPPAAAFVGVEGQTRMFALPGAEVADQAHGTSAPGRRRSPAGRGGRCRRRPGRRRGRSADRRR
jgi:hypothetical protein